MQLFYRRSSSNCRFNPIKDNANMFPCRFNSIKDKASLFFHRFNTINDNASLFSRRFNTINDNASLFSHISMDVPISHSRQSFSLSQSRAKVKPLYSIHMLRYLKYIFSAHEPFPEIISHIRGIAKYRPSSYPCS